MELGEAGEGTVVELGKEVDADFVRQLCELLPTENEMTPEEMEAAEMLGGDVAPPGGSSNNQADPETAISNSSPAPAPAVATPTTTNTKTQLDPLDEALRRLLQSEPLSLAHARVVLEAARDDDERVFNTLPVSATASPFVAERGSAYIVSRAHAQSREACGTATSVAFQSVQNSEVWWAEDGVGVAARPMGRYERAARSGGEPPRLHGYRGRLYTLVTRTPVAQQQQDGAKAVDASNPKRRRRGAGPTYARAAADGGGIGLVQVWRAASQPFKDQQPGAASPTASPPHHHTNHRPMMPPPVISSSSSAASSSSSSPRMGASTNSSSSSNGIGAISQNLGLLAKSNRPGGMMLNHHQQRHMVPAKLEHHEDVTREGQEQMAAAVTPSSRYDLNRLATTTEEVEITMTQAPPLTLAGAGNSVSSITSNSSNNSQQQQMPVPPPPPSWAQQQPLERATVSSNSNSNNTYNSNNSSNSNSSSNSSSNHSSNHGGGKNINMNNNSINNSSSMNNNMPAARATTRQQSDQQRALAASTPLSERLNSKFSRSANAPSNCGERPNFATPPQAMPPNYNNDSNNIYNSNNYYQQQPQQQQQQQQPAYYSPSNNSIAGAGSVNNPVSVAEDPLLLSGVTTRELLLGGNAPLNNAPVSVSGSDKNNSSASGSNDVQPVTSPGGTAVPDPVHHHHHHHHHHYIDEGSPTQEDLCGKEETAEKQDGGVAGGNSQLDLAALGEELLREQEEEDEEENMSSSSSSNNHPANTGMMLDDDDEEDNDGAERKKRKLPAALDDSPQVMFHNTGNPAATLTAAGLTAAGRRNSNSNQNSVETGGDATENSVVSGSLTVRGNVHVAGYVYGQVVTPPFAADYAEWFPWDEAQSYTEEGEPASYPPPGSVVKLNYGTNCISMKTRGEGPCMIVSTTPSIAAGVPMTREAASQGALVAFLGQVPTRCTGVVNVGDVLIPSGLDDGCAVAHGPRSRYFGPTLGTAMTATRSKEEDDEEDLEEGHEKDPQIIQCFVRWNVSVSNTVNSILNKHALNRFQQALLWTNFHIAATYIVLNIALACLLVESLAVSRSARHRLSSSKDTILDCLLFLASASFLLTLIIFATWRHKLPHRSKLLGSYTVLLAAVLSATNFDLTESHRVYRGYIHNLIWCAYVLYGVLHHLLVKRISRRILELDLVPPKMPLPAFLLCCKMQTTTDNKHGQKPPAWLSRLFGGISSSVSSSSSTRSSMSTASLSPGTPAANNKKKRSSHNTRKHVSDVPVENTTVCHG